MNKPSKCKNCEWFGKPYWSVINPCDSCPREETTMNIFIDTEDMEERYGEELYEEYLEKENKRLNNIINELKKYLEIYNKNEVIKLVLDRIKELENDNK